MRIAVFSCLGLGDGLISLILSNNLAKNHCEVDTFHPSLHSLQAWFPHLPLKSFPSEEKIEEVLALYDRFFLFYEKSDWMFKILDWCQKKAPQKLTVLNPIATPNCDYPYWEGGKFDGRLTFVENLVNFCRHSLQLHNATDSNGITPLADVVFQRYPKRIVLHPTSSKEEKNWPWKRFEILANRLEKSGFEPWFVLSPAEKIQFPACRSPSTKNLSELAHFVAESGGMIGNDSGIGHLASCLGLPSVTISRNKQQSSFWRPGWAPTNTLTPPSWIPNLKFIRLRDKYWKYLISVKEVQRVFTKLYHGLNPFC